MNFIIKLFLNAVAVVIASYALSGIHVDGFGYAIAIAFVLAILNVSLKPILVIIKVAAWMIGSPGFVVDGWGWAILFSLLLSILNSVLEKVVKPAIAPKESDTKVYDKDGNRIA